MSSLILIVEDNARNLKLIRDLLKHHLLAGTSKSAPGQRGCLTSRR